MDEPVSVVVNVMNIKLCFLDIIVILPACFVVDHNQFPASDGVNYLRAAGV